MGVDGFRFDLGTILAREKDGFNERHAFHMGCRQDPILSQRKLIAEPWDCGLGGYQVGAFPPGWVEWNDRFRDTVRTFWRGDKDKLPELASRVIYLIGADANPIHPLTLSLRMMVSACAIW